MLRGCNNRGEVIWMTSLTGRDFDLLARILAMRGEQLAKLEERRERLSKARRWDA